MVVAPREGKPLALPRTFGDMREPELIEVERFVKGGVVDEGAKVAAGVSEGVVVMVLMVVAPREGIPLALLLVVGDME